MNFRAIIYCKRGASLVGKGDVEESDSRSLEASHYYERAIVDFDQAIRLDPKFAEAYRRRGDAWRKLGSYDQAIASFDQAIRYDPNDASAYVLRGIAWEDKKDHDRAIADFDQAIRLDPRSAFAYFRRGVAVSRLEPMSILSETESVALSESKDHDRAIADFDRAIQLASDYFHAYFYRGVAYQVMGDYERAINDFDNAIRVDNDALTMLKIVVRIYRDRAFEFKKKLDGAFDPGLTKDMAYLERGRIWAQKREHYERAIADFNEAIQLNAANAYSYRERGIVQFNRASYGLAIVDFNRAIRLIPVETSFRMLRGAAWYNKEDYGRAIADANEVIRLDPKNGFAHSLRGVAYRRKGEFSIAITDLTLALKLGVGEDEEAVRRELELAHQRQRG